MLTARQMRSVLWDRLEAGRVEIEVAALGRSRLLSGSSDLDDPMYVDGLRAAISAAIGFGLAIVERGEDDAPPIPSPLLEQARLAARSKVPLAIVVRRYFAGYTLFLDSLLMEAEDEGVVRSALQGLMREQARGFDCLLAAVTGEYGREVEVLRRTSTMHRVERIERLLDGALLDMQDLDYDFKGRHLGLIAKGSEAEDVLRGIAARLDRRLLTAPRGDGVIWAWLGGKANLHSERVETAMQDLPSEITLTVGEQSGGFAGWRLTHQQARAALPIALRGEGGVVRYADVALLVSLRQDDLLASSLRNIYLAPLADDRDGGATLRRTLRTYIASERNISSAAAALGVSRRTVANRLREVESRIGRPLSSALTEIDAALRLEEVEEGTKG